jgi:lipoprotein YgeR
LETRSEDRRVTRLATITEIKVWLALCCLAVICVKPLTAETLGHTVSRGDTLYAIAKKYNVPLDALRRANELSDTDTIKPGMVLTIPDVYVVEKGDTLYGIARKFGITLDELIGISGRRKDQVLLVGESIYIPRRTETAKTGSDGSSTTGETRTGQLSGTALTDDARNLDQPAVRPVSVGVGTRSSWPLGGERSFLDGKLPRVVIKGAVGERVLCIAPGRVIWVGTWGYFGRTVFIQSAAGYVYIYAGNETVSVKVGDEIQLGGEVGTLGVSPGSAEPILHFFVYKDGKPVHPDQAPRG